MVSPVFPSNPQRLPNSPPPFIDSIYLLYKNSLTAMAQSRPQIYSVSPPLLDTMGGQTVTMALLIDSTVVDLARPYALEVVIGTFRCTDPSLRPYDGAAKATVTAMIGPQGNIVASPPASNKADAAAGAIGAVPFPTMLPPETTQQPFLLTCTSSAGVGSHLPAQATISQGGAEVPLLMAKAASYATPVVLSIAATGSAAKGGFDVRVTGKNFGARDFQPMVLLQETPCMATLWESDTSVVCQVSKVGLANDVDCKSRVHSHQPVPDSQMHRVRRRGWAPSKSKSRWPGRPAWQCRPRR